MFNLKNAYFLNSIWLIIDKFAMLAGGLIVSTIVARYLGPEQLGKISLGVSMSLLCLSISHWGASYTIFNTAANKPVRSYLYIRDTFYHRLCLYVLAWLLSSVYLFYSLSSDDALFVSVVCISNIFLALDIYQFHLNGSLQSKVNAKASLAAKLTSISIRILLVVVGTNLWWFVLPIAIEGAILFYRKSTYFKNKYSHIKYRKDKSISLYYFKNGLPYLISSFLIVVYTKVNEIFLNQFMSFNELGIYSASLLLGGAWIFLPSSIGTSLFSKALNSGYRKDYSIAYFATIIVSIPIIIIYCIFPEMITNIVFGEEYQRVSEILPYMCIASLFSLLGFFNNRHIATTTKGGKFLLNKTICLAIASILTSYVMVSSFGLIGVALSYMFVELINLTLLNYFNRVAKVELVHYGIFKIKTNTLQLINIFKS
ncbi:oligosaccharide flippase family protein [Vibrio breoganii]|uniref:oligosaccharide flippase family protein n=1 Tax=Vibrio breoganii TaxID=553239 RepID=UPI00031A6F27|nr:oligosaccharide flippase family protein [Vibrio breoganii]OED96327.1 hypothetical protein A1QG_13580 [Vibrio breoganii ZF-29]TKG21072.1 hypothetical protein FCV81_10065 [Vibrio breoganii]